MRFVIQRVAHASVSVDGKVLGKIDKGYMVLIGVSGTDTREVADRMVKKMLGLRIFEDENGKTNLSLETVGGGLLGIGGMLLGVPLAATVYKLIRSDVNERNRRKAGGE